MIPKLIRNRPVSYDQGQRFRARLKYVFENATTTKLVNLTGDWETAARQMEFTAGLNPRVRMPCRHIVISFSETEHHTDEELITAMQMVLQDIGAGEHQSAIGTHRNRPSSHVHGAINLVHPVTGVALPMSHSFARLELACRKVELHMGWPADRGRFDVTKDGDDVVLRPKPEVHWRRKNVERALGLRPESRAARENQRRFGGEFLRDSLGKKIDQIRFALDSAGSWPVVHSALAGLGFLYQRYRAGARIVEAATHRHMSASALGTRYGMHQMCNRLGAFVAQTLPLTLTKTSVQTGVRGALRRLKRDQARKGKSIGEKLNGVRSPAAQALRVILREVQVYEVNNLKETLGLPKPRPEPEAIKSVSSRYGHALRLSMSGMLEVDDHTTRRQNWMMTPQDVARDLPDVLVPLVAQFPDSIRTDGEGNLLFAAHSISGSIQSFDRLSLQSMPPIVMQKTSTGGVCAIGAHPANICLLVRTHLDAITELLQIDGFMPMVIVVGDAPDPSHMAHIEWLAKGRSLAIATASFENTPDLKDQLRRTFPNAKFWTSGSADYAEPVEAPSDDRDDEPPLGDGPSL